MNSNPGRRGAAVAISLLLTLAACSGDDSDTAGEADAPSTTQAVAATATATVEPGPVSTLSAVIEVRADEPVRPTATAVAGGHEVRVPAPEEAAEDVELALVGLRPETEYEITVDGVEEPLTFTSGALPDDFPPLRLAEVDADADAIASGLTLLSLKPWSPAPSGRGSAPAAGGYLAAVDHEGFVVWYHPTEVGVLDARMLPSGNVMFTYDEVALREIDVLGRTVRELAGRVALDRAPTDPFGRPRTSGDATRVETDSVHHDATPLPNGNVVLLSTELREMTGPAQCDEPAGEATYQIIADVIVEIDPDSGEVAKEWPLLDVYDPFERPGSELCIEGSPFAPPNFFYADVEGVRDWTHANSVVLDEERNELVVSARHLSAVFALRYEDDDDGPAGQLLWELGPDGTLELDGEPSYYQHAAEVLRDDELLVYDNGNSRPSAPISGGGAPPYSRGVIYELDRDGGTARQVWEHRLEHPDGRPVFTAFLGDADQLPNGNILLTHGAIGDAQGRFTARIVEVVRDSGEVVFDLTVGDEASQWTVYRSERFETLTP